MNSKNWVLIFYNPVMTGWQLCLFWWIWCFLWNISKKSI